MKILNGLLTLEPEIDLPRLQALGLPVHYQPGRPASKGPYLEVTVRALGISLQLFGYADDLTVVSVPTAPEHIEGRLNDCQYDRGRRYLRIDSLNDWERVLAAMVSLHQAAGIGLE